jgi:hypothetical protein
MTSPNGSSAHGDLAEGISRIARDRDVIEATSTNKVHARAAAAADEYRLLVSRTTLGTGARLFVGPVDLEFTSVEASNATILARHQRTPAPTTPTRVHNAGLRSSGR